MITRINWTDGYGNPRRDFVLATFVHEGACFAVIGWNDFTVLQFDPDMTKCNIMVDEPYQELFCNDH